MRNFEVTKGQNFLDLLQQGENADVNNRKRNFIPIYKIHISFVNLSQFIFDVFIQNLLKEL
jgi:hypothetical protein